MSGIFRKCKYGGHFTKHLKKILLSLGLIALGSINFSSASFTAVINNQSIQDGANINVTDIYNQYGEGILCVSSVGEGLLVIYFDEYWNVFNSINLNIPNSKSCVFSDGSFPMFSIFNGNGYYSYYVAGGNSQCPTENEICPNIRLNIVNARNEIEGTGLNLTNYSNSDRLVSNIYYSGNLQFSQNNGNLLMSTINNCGTLENQLAICEGLNEDLEDDIDACERELNICTPALTECINNSNGSGNYGSGINWSSLFINDIQHIGAPLINITIPEEIERNYTGTEEEFTLDIEGYGYDEEKIINMINTQNYKPTSEEMASLIGKFADFVPLLGVCILFLFIRYIIKKVFRF